MNFIKMVLAVLVAQFLLAGTLMFGLVMFSALLSGGDEVHVADNSWLVLDIYGDIPSYDPPESIASALTGGDETVSRLLINLEKAAADKRIAGVLMKVSSANSLGLASIDELRAAVTRVRGAGKPVIAFSDGLDRNALYLAAACDSIFMPAVGDVIFTGYGMVDMFAKGTLEKLDIHQNLHKIRDYKTAAEMMQRDSMSPESKEMANWLIDDVWAVQLGAISRERGIPMDAMETHMAHALFSANEALEVGFIDGIRYWDEVEASVRGDADELEAISSDEYADVSRAEAGLKGKKRIAVVHAWGMIGGRRSRTDPSLGVMMGHQTVIRDLRAAADDDRVEAIIFRVDSRGGEALASELISREVGRIAKEKPVIVSMGDVAASGGYAVSYRATKIVADSLTITGSIGSIYGKINMAGLWNKAGISFDWVTRGPNALLWAGVTDFDEEQWERVAEHHDASFQQWLENISAARGIPVEDLIPVTEGRVWTGRQALERRLVDEIGGFPRAIEVAREEAGIPDGEEVTFVNYPQRRGLYSLLTSGDAPLTLLRWTIYKWMREDVAETARFVTGGRMRLWTGMTE